MGDVVKLSIGQRGVVDKKDLREYGGRSVVLGRLWGDAVAGVAEHLDEDGAALLGRGDFTGEGDAHAPQRLTSSGQTFPARSEHQRHQDFL